ncbi:NADP-dependent malic enzyme, partial [bacterium]|nr:NADP-dependent malic enzyme [bacterium]
SLHEMVGSFMFTPRIALMSFSNFGTVKHPSTDKMRRTAEILWEKHPDWEVEGEMHADVAVSYALQKTEFPDTKLSDGANCLVFPDLNSANIAMRLMRQLGGATAVGPILTGLDMPMHVLANDADVDSIVNIAAIAAVQKLDIEKQKRK